MKSPDSPRALAIAHGAAMMVRGSMRVGYVHSVFRRAANLWLAPNTLLAIAEPTAMRAPNGIVLDAPAASPGETFLGLRVGMTVRAGDGFVGVPAAGLCIDLADAPLWDPRLQILVRPIAPAILSQQLDRLTCLIRGGARAKRLSFASVLDPLAGQTPGSAALEPREEAHRERLACRVRPAASDLLSGIAACESGWISSAAQRLAGLGHGLTPSGDDFLIGICGALALAAAALPAGQGCRPVGARLDQAMAIAAAAAGRTTLLSAIWLDHAARGEFSAEVGDLLVSLTDANANGLDGTAARLLAVGGLSGLDTAVGVLLGSRAVLCSYRPSCTAVSHRLWPLSPTWGGRVPAQLAVSESRTIGERA